MSIIIQDWEDNEEYQGLKDKYIKHRRKETQTMAVSEQDSLSEDQYEVVKSAQDELQDKLRLAAKIIVVALLCWLAIHHYLSTKQIPTTQYQDQLYALYPTAYTTKHITNPRNIQPQTIWQQITTRQSINIYIPSHSLYIVPDQYQNSQCFLGHYDQCWRQSLIAKGVMLQQVQLWILDQIVSEQKILVIWMDQLALSVLLIGLKLRHNQITDNVYGGEVLIMFDPKLSKHQLNALKLTIIQLGLSNLHFLQSQQLLLPENINQYDLVIGQGKMLHVNIMGQFLGNTDVKDEVVKEELAKTYLTTFTNTKLLLLYPQPISAEDMWHYNALENAVKTITNSHSQPYYILEDITRTSQLHFGEGEGVVVVQTYSGNTHIVYDQPSNKQNGGGGEYIQQQPEQQTDIPVQTQTIQVYKQLPPIPTILRMDSDKILALLECQTRDNPDLFYDGQYMKTDFKQIQIKRQQSLSRIQLIKITHLSKFIANYFTATGPSNILLAADWQILSNLIAHLNQGNIFLPVNSLQKSQTIKQSLHHNKLDGMLHAVEFDNSEVSGLLGRQEIRLVVIDLLHFIQWRGAIVSAMDRNMDVIMLKQGNINQNIFVGNLIAESSVKVYVISKRQQTIYDYQCINDFEFQLYSEQQTYPQNSFMLLTKQTINVQPHDPKNAKNNQRTTSLSPYECSNPPYSKINTPAFNDNYIVMNNKYEMPVVVQKQLQQLYQNRGVDQEGIVQYLRSSLYQTDVVIIYSEASHNMLIYVNVIKIVGERGKCIITDPEQNHKQAIEQSAQLNNLQNAYEISAVSIYDPFSVSQLYEDEQPTVVIIAPGFLQRDSSLLKQLKKQSMVLFKYTIKDYSFDGFIAELMRDYKIYLIKYSPKEVDNGQCSNYKIKPINQDNYNNQEMGWFVILI